MPQLSIFIVNYLFITHNYKIDYVCVSNFQNSLDRLGQ